MKNRRIAFYLGSLTKGGAERVVVNLAEYFKEKGYEVFVVTKLQADTEYSLSEGIVRIIADITKEEERGRIRNLFLRIVKLRRIIKQINPAVLVSFIGKNNLMSIVATRGTGIPVAVSVRSNPTRELGDGFRRKLYFAMFRLAEGVVLQTTDAKEFFPKSIQRKSIVLQNSLNSEFVRPLYTGEKKKEIVTVGRIDANKNQRMMIEAFVPLVKEFPEWKMIFYGDGDERDSLEKRVCELGLTDNIFFKGTQSNIPEKIEASSIFVLPSKQEGMPNALIEAMVLGLAAISTDCPCGGPKDLIVPEENGLLIPVDDTQALTEALRRLMKENYLREKLAKNAALLIEKVRPEHINRQWEDYLKKVAARK